MATLRSVGIGLLASLLVGAVASSVALAKKPGSDPPPPPPPPPRALSDPVDFVPEWTGHLPHGRKSKRYCRGILLRPRRDLACIRVLNFRQRPTVLRSERSCVG